jgi:hypothetical protein
MFGISIWYYHKLRTYLIEIDCHLVLNLQISQNNSMFFIFKFGLHFTIHVYIDHNALQLIFKEFTLFVRSKVS